MFKSIDLQFRCSNCDFTSLDVKATQIHLKLCDKPDDYECFVCDKSFKTERILSKHHLHIHGLSDGYEDIETNDQPILNDCHANDQPNLDDNQTKILTEVENDKDNGQVPDTQVPDTQTCPICKQTFVKERALLNHLLKEHIDQTDKEPSKRLYQCYECQVEFNHLDSLNDHIATKHKKAIIEKTPEVYKCKTCLHEFNLESKLLLHMKTKHANQPKTSTNHELEESINIKEELIEDDAFEPIKVKIETIKTEPIVKMEVDTIDEFDENGFKCQVCSSKFTNIHELKHHILVIHLFTQFECHHCQNNFENFEELQSHSCMEIMTFICHICDDNRSFDLTDNLSNHLLDFHFRIEEPQRINEIPALETNEEPEKTKEIPTPENETNEDTSMPKRKMKNHSESLQKCQLCDQEFDQIEQLINHYIIDHTKRNQCQKCDLHFKSYAKLHWHKKKSHPNEEKRKLCNSCPICLKEFTGLETLKNHILGAHLKVFSCKICKEKSFSSKNYLKLHLRKKHKMKK